MKKPSLKTLRNRLDTVFSKHIRERDANSEGYGRCVTCYAWRLLEAGHFIRRQHVGTRWDVRNVHGQCYYCNHRLHGNLISYTLFMQKVYGQDVVDELMRLKRTTVKFTRSDYEEMIRKFS